MAKEEKEGKNGKGMLMFVVILMITNWLTIMALLIKCDVGGFGSTVLRPIFKNVPIINYILPPPSDAEIAKENDYPYNTFPDALDQVEKLDNENKELEAKAKLSDDKIKELEAEVARLSYLDDEKKTLEEEKNKFYSEIVYGESAPDTDTYIEWYNKLDPEYAENVYRDIVSAKEADNKIKELANAYEGMDRKKAASILENMSNDLDAVALILNNMGSKARGEILAEMDADYAANVTKKLMP
ncbi:MAG: hypothetical protein PUG10_10535 [Lachnospiraceae bacterium]|nr:hypothetical protein [Lachnospiraceae bacterium]